MDRAGESALARPGFSFDQDYGAGALRGPAREIDRLQECGRSADQPPEAGQLVDPVTDPFELGALDAVQAILGRPVVPVISSGDAIMDAINKVYERRSDGDELGEKEGAEEDELTDLIDVEDEAPIIRWVNSLFFEAVKRRASDIHIESLEREVGVRYRVDGVLHEAKTAKKAFLPSLNSDWCTCMPLPLTPNIGLGIKVA